MIMVIFGAGASYDSVPSRSPKIGIYRRKMLPSRPPLATELFLDLDFFIESYDSSLSACRSSRICGRLPQE
jgi:hypothetical protein